MAMTGFICHDDYYDRLKRLTNEEVGSLFRQLMLYHAKRYDEMTDFVDGEGIAFDFIASDIDRAEEKYNATCETNRNNGSKGGRPRKQQEPTETEQNPEKPTETEQNPEKPYIKDKNKDIDKEKEKNSNRRFTPPSIQEVTDYCLERGNGINPQAFIDFYASKGWKVGSQPMKDWRACVRTWEQRERKPAKILPAQNYQQRDYTEEELLAVSDDIIAQIMAQRENDKEEPDAVNS